MQVTFNWITVLLAVFISQSFFAAGLLLFNRENRLSNRFLAVLILAIALWLTDDFMRIAGIYHQKPNWYFLPLFYSLSFGPLIWFYVRSLVNNQFRFGKRSLLHFIPVLLQATLCWLLTFSSYSTKYWYWGACAPALYLPDRIRRHLDIDGCLSNIILPARTALPGLAGQQLFRGVPHTPELVKDIARRIDHIVRAMVH